METAINPREIVIAYVEALNREDYQTARQYVANDVSFDGVLGSRQGADAYFEDMKRMRLKYDVKKVFADANDVCVLYDVTLSGVRLFTCAWYRVEGEKIQSLKVVFDPRPVLAQKAT